jgi:hypothetical protein
MPTVAVIDGAKIQFYWDDHPPAHFHIEVGEYRAQVAIETLEVVNGWIPAPQLRKVKTWAVTRKEPLLAAWSKCQADLHPGRIA